MNKEYMYLFKCLHILMNRMFEYIVKIISKVRCSKMSKDCMTLNKFCKGDGILYIIWLLDWMNLPPQSKAMYNLLYILEWLHWNIKRSWNNSNIKRGKIYKSYIVVDMLCIAFDTNSTELELLDNWVSMTANTSTIQGSKISM